MLANAALHRRTEVSLRHEMVVFGLEKGQGLIIAAKLAIIDIANFAATLPALLLAGPHPHEHADVEVRLQAEQRLDVLALTAGC